VILIGSGDRSDTLAIGLDVPVGASIDPASSYYFGRGAKRCLWTFTDVLTDENLINEWIGRVASDAANIKKFAASVRIDTAQLPDAKKPKRIDLQSLQKNVSNRQPEDVVEIALARAIDCNASDLMFQSLAHNRTLRIKFKVDGTTHFLPSPVAATTRSLYRGDSGDS